MRGSNFHRAKIQVPLSSSLRHPTDRDKQKENHRPQLQKKKKKDAAHHNHYQRTQVNESQNIVLRELLHNDRYTIFHCYVPGE